MIFEFYEEKIPRKVYLKFEFAAVHLTGKIQVFNQNKISITEYYYQILYPLLNVLTV